MVENDGQMLINGMAELLDLELARAEEGGFRTRAHRTAARSFLQTLTRAAKSGRADANRVAQLRQRMAELPR